jgi:predicted AAA+ superfamily ATPase
VTLFWTSRIWLPGKSTHAVFDENYITEGMKTLLEQGFRRLEGKSNQGVFRLKQAMGGGKTRNLLTLGLLAKHPEYREKVMGSFHKPDKELGVA